MLGNFYDVLMDGGDCLILIIVFLSSAHLLSGLTHRDGEL